MLSHNQISEICSSSGEIINGQMQLQSDANEHFQILFQEDSKTEAKLNYDFLSNIPSLVSQEDNAGLVKIFSQKEVVDVIWAMEPDKALRPDGFTIHFYRLCWNVIKFNLLQMISSFLKKSKVGGNTNSTFLVLIPKEANPIAFDRF